MIVVRGIEQKFREVDATLTIEGRPLMEKYKK